MADRNYEDVMIEKFRNDPNYAVAMINTILEDGEDQGELLITLRQIAKAYGGMQTVAEKAGLNATQLYRTLSEQGNPSLNSVIAILKSIGLRLAVERVEAA